MSTVLQTKQRFGIIGNSHGLNRAIDIALQVATTDLSVLITGESGVGKEIFPQIVHQNSSRKHGQYIAVNCGAIPEGTIDSELFGHEKGSFTGAQGSRKGYFEVADKGTIFLDEVAELPLSTQVRLLRVLETGEFIRVGSSSPQKTNVRVIAATNVNVIELIQQGRFREDLFYRLNTVPISIPPLRNRKEDIHLLFRKFATDFADKYRMPFITLNDDAVQVLQTYEWPGNIRQLKNITEQISIIEQNRNIPAEILKSYLPDYSTSRVPALVKAIDEKTFASEREILYNVLFDMKRDMNELKKLVHDLMQNPDGKLKYEDPNAKIMSELRHDYSTFYENKKNQDIFSSQNSPVEIIQKNIEDIQDTEEFVEESLSLIDKEREMINKALSKHNGKRKYAANELGISERTLYRKIKEYDI
ncbi:MAG TPA: sigma-54-dependent Fis family transcriptional regulator [Bacteroidales bacterium]|nr:MAG: sigma-54-dependent Fis family transcriptional regulator [Bacteroidetes bacterium GWF2_33_38]OFY74013.1 MAG: sigma-54-dependent Fis family transcriptional regulator [Bacteroidetes bacterium RIFOXYA12_FULL_33_9]OFY90671.1 MAG: sigma-54-dependent Fis family transcriptional regulator [Bacteroidetes bacterium RIFOXYA2_FULL_33_7]HBF88920.1 sigma-54-dependent Fis family transcriptional regulator [Bacteroidales bacterium]